VRRFNFITLKIIKLCTLWQKFPVVFVANL